MGNQQKPQSNTPQQSGTDKPAAPQTTELANAITSAVLGQASDEIQEQSASAPPPVAAPAPTPKPSVTITQNNGHKQTPAKEVSTTMTNRASQPDTTSQSSQLNRILEGLSESDRSSIDMLLSYIEEMAPGRPMEPERGGQLQVGLYRILTNIINNETQNFDKLWTAVLKLFEIHRDGAFHFTHAYRFFDSQTYSLTKNEGAAFCALLNLLIATGPAAARPTVSKQVDFEKTLRYGYTDEGRARVLSFYKVS